MNLDELKRVEVARVFKGRRRAARLSRIREGVMFEYDPDYAGPDVATTLPRDAGSVRHAGGALPPFFSGLLPEGRRLTAIRSAAKTSADDELTLLLAVGADTIGDVQVLPEGLDPDAAARTDVVMSLEEADFAELFARVLGPEPIDRVGIPGVQDKVSGRMISLPVAYAGAEWILKLDPPEFPHLVANEAFFLDAARRSGLAVVESRIEHDKSGRPGLFVRRFDRIVRDGERIAIGQEDACQVLGRYPADKYRLDAEELVQGLARVTGAPMVAARTLVQQLAFAYLTCNGDAHGKNFTIMRPEDEWRIAPAYDLPSSHPYGDTTMALTIGGKQREDIGRDEFVGLGLHCGVAPRATTRVLDDLLEAMPSWLGRLEELPFDRRRVHELRQACRCRADRLRG